MLAEGELTRTVADTKESGHTPGGSRMELATGHVPTLTPNSVLEEGELSVKTVNQGSSGRQ
jgi:hypothetical protein